uniref:Guanine nucleotide-binding protein subunit gamma n=1 Tax=Sinocyclocheilus grahami TaxID=75366 RepID=A0A672REV8_SINGR
MLVRSLIPDQFIRREMVRYTVELSTDYVSKAAADLMAYCDAHIREDPLIVPVPASENPFREKKFFCTIL